MFDVAGPVLAEHRLPAHVFLVTDLVGTPEVPWPDRVWLAFHHASAARVDLRGLGLGTLGLETPPRRAATLEAVLQTLKGRSAVEKDALITRLEQSLGVSKARSPDDFRMATWEQVQAEARKGLFTFGPHSRTHDILSRVGDEEVERQIAGSREDVERLLGTNPTVFAYPNGRAEDFDERSQRAVREAGFTWALATELGLVGADSNPLALPAHRGGGGPLVHEIPAPLCRLALNPERRLPTRFFGFPSDGHHPATARPEAPPRTAPTSAGAHHADMDMVVLPWYGKAQGHLHARRHDVGKPRPRRPPARPAQEPGRP